MPDDKRGPSLISSEQAGVLSRLSAVEVSFERKAPPISLIAHISHIFSGRWNRRSQARLASRTGVTPQSEIA